MQGVTESKAQEIFNDLWHNDEFEWDFEREHFCSQCNKYGLDTILGAKYDLLKARQANKQISNEMNFLFGCARKIQERERARESGSHRRGAPDASGTTPEGFNSYLDYWNHLYWKIQEDYPDTPEQAAQRTKEVRR